MTTCTRIIEFDAAHRLLGHESKCAHNHGHRYRVEVECAADLDSVGRVIDFSDIKRKLGSWIDENIDHGTIANANDHAYLASLEAMGETRVYRMAANPTAENIAAEILRVGTAMLDPIRVVRVRVWETPNCFAEVRA